MKSYKKLAIGISLLALEIFILFLFFSFPSQEVSAGTGSPLSEQTTELEVGNSFPSVHNVTVNNELPITLVPNSTKRVQCIAIIVDYNGESDINHTNATFFSTLSSSTDPDDNNNHYSNSSCEINTAFVSFNGIADDTYSALSNCTFYIDYYANPGSWNCTIQVNDSKDSKGEGSGIGAVSELLSLGLPDLINYGIINATSVSGQQSINITNYGNIKVNLSLEGYGATPNDGNAMNCTLGSNKNISIELEKYNLTSSVSGGLSVAQFQANYKNLTTNPITKQFNLTSRIDDAAEDTQKPTYWRIYVPTGVAGTCTGSILFGATKAPGN